MDTAVYKTEDKENLGMKIFPADPCRRQSFGAKVAGRTLWPGLKPARTMQSITATSITSKDQALGAMANSAT